MAKDANYWIETLGLVRHPEGGYYREIFKVDARQAKSARAADQREGKAIPKSIQFLLEGEDFCAFHRLRSDEVWRYHLGAPLALHLIQSFGRYEEAILGSDTRAGEELQVSVDAGTWLAARVRDGKSFGVMEGSLVSQFGYHDFELGKREELVARFAQHRALIERMTRQ